MNGGVSAPSLTEADSAAAIVEVASYMQEQLDDEAWPLCPSHAYGLRAEVLDDSPVWRCRFGDHTVAYVGSLADPETPQLPFGYSAARSAVGQTGVMQGQAAASGVKRKLVIVIALMAIAAIALAVGGLFALRAADKVAGPHLSTDDRRNILAADCARLRRLKSSYEVQADSDLNRGRALREGIQLAAERQQTLHCA